MAQEIGIKTVFVKLQRESLRPLKEIFLGLFFYKLFRVD